MSVTLSYGGVSITPVPLITIGKTFQKTANGLPVGQVYDIALRGFIVETGAGGLPTIIDGVRNIRNIFNRDGKYFQITCNGTTLLEGYPRIISEIQFNESSDNWVFTCPYSLTLQFDVEPVGINIAGSGENTNLLSPYISEYEDNWSFEFDDSVSKYILPVSGGNTDINSFTIRATHEISAQGKAHYDGPGNTGTLTKQAWQWAKDFVVTKLNQTAEGTLPSGVFNLAGSWTPYNQMRVQRLNEAGGTFSVTETIVLASGSRSIIEEFDVDVRTNVQDPFISISINGTIQGLESRSYGSASGDFNISSTKWANASGYFETIRDGLMIYPRVLALGNAEGVSINSEPLNKVITKSPPRGVITYNYEYNNRPSNCITGAKTESIVINDENPNDVFARLLVLGRSQGPILQSFNTVTDFRRTVSVDALMSPPTGCSISILTGGNNPRTQVSSILCGFENDLRGRYNKVYKERDTEIWDPKNGRYSRAVSWAAVDCTSIPAISLCSGA